LHYKIENDGQYPPFPDFAETLVLCDDYPEMIIFSLTKEN